VNIFKEEYLARSCIEIARLPKDKDTDMEIKAIAFCD